MNVYNTCISSVAFAGIVPVHGGGSGKHLLAISDILNSRHVTIVRTTCDHRTCSVLFGTLIWLKLPDIKFPMYCNIVSKYIMEHRKAISISGYSKYHNVPDLIKLPEM